jgi:outer membrane protein TolC
LDETRAWVDARIEQLLADLDQGRTLIDLYRKEILPEAEANVESAFSLYRIGDVDFLTLVDAQTTKNRFEQEYYQLLARYGTAVAELEMTVGRELPMAPALLAEVP